MDDEFSFDNTDTLTTVSPLDGFSLREDADGNTVMETDAGAVTLMGVSPSMISLEDFFETDSPLDM